MAFATRWLYCACCLATRFGCRGIRRYGDVKEDLLPNLDEPPVALQIPPPEEAVPVGTVHDNTVAVASVHEFRELVHFALVLGQARVVSTIRVDLQIPLASATAPLLVQFAELGIETLVSKQWNAWRQPRAHPRSTHLVNEGRYGDDLHLSIHTFKVVWIREPVANSVEHDRASRIKAFAITEQNLGNLLRSERRQVQTEVRLD